MQFRAFSIDPESGEIRTARALDFESEPTHRLLVTAKDSAPDSRFGTASVTVLVGDVQDEKPVFEKSVYEGSVPENKANHDILQVKVILFGSDKGNQDLYISQPRPQPIHLVSDNILHYRLGTRTLLAASRT